MNERWHLDLFGFGLLVGVGIAVLGPLVQWVERRLRRSGIGIGSRRWEGEADVQPVRWVTLAVALAIGLPATTSASWAWLILGPAGLAQLPRWRVPARCLLVIVVTWALAGLSPPPATSTLVLLAATATAIAVVPDLLDRRHERTATRTPLPPASRDGTGTEPGMATGTEAGTEPGMTAGGEPGIAIGGEARTEPGMTAGTEPGMTAGTGAGMTAGGDAGMTAGGEPGIAIGGEAGAGAGEALRGTAVDDPERAWEGDQWGGGVIGLLLAALLWTAVPDTEPLVAVVGALLPLAILDLVRGADLRPDPTVGTAILAAAVIGFTGRPAGAVVLVAVVPVHLAARRLGRARPLVPADPAGRAALAATAVALVALGVACRTGGLRHDLAGALPFALAATVVGTVATALAVARSRTWH